MRPEGSAAEEGSHATALRIRRVGPLTATAGEQEPVAFPVDAGVGRDLDRGIHLCLGCLEMGNCWTSVDSVDSDDLVGVGRTLSYYALLQLMPCTRIEQGLECYP